MSTFDHVRSSPDQENKKNYVYSIYIEWRLILAIVNPQRYSWNSHGTQELWPWNQRRYNILASWPWN